MRFLQLALKFSLALAATIGIFACGPVQDKSGNPDQSSENAREILSHSTDFASGDGGWIAGFADYPKGSEDFYELHSGISKIPGKSRDGYALSGNNHSDDLFMFIKKKLGRAEGNSPLRTYEVRFDVELASNAGKQCVGVGGAPGESVFLKAGASRAEPVAQIMEGHFLTMNIDKGAQSQAGSDALVLGNVANGLSCDQAPQYLTIRKSSPEPLRVTSTQDAELWLIVGTDSGFEGITTLYYEKIQASLTPVTGGVSGLERFD